MKIIHFFALLFFVLLTESFSCKAQDINPVIQFVQKEIDLGTVMSGDSAVCFFEFFNTGTYPLMLTEAKTTCGCTVAEFPKIPLAPGESDRIRIQLDTTDKLGRIRKVITIYSNAINSEERIAVTILVKKELE
jgi:hypothetical protein